MLLQVRAHARAFAKFANVLPISMQNKCYSRSICMPVWFSRGHGRDIKAMACCFACDSTRHCMPMRCMHDDPPRPWHAVLRVVPRCSFLTHTSIILLPPRLEHPESGMQSVSLWHVDLRACCSHTSPPLRPTAPPQRSSPRCRKPSSSARSASCGHASCSRPSDTRHRHAHLHHPFSLPDCSIQGPACKK